MSDVNLEKKRIRREMEHQVFNKIEPIRLAILGSLVEKTGWIWHLTLDISLLNWAITCKCISGSLDAGVENSRNNYGFLISFQDYLWDHTGFDDFIDRVNYLANYIIARYQKRQIHLRDNLLSMRVEEKAQKSTELSRAYRGIRYGELPSV